MLNPWIKLLEQPPYLLPEDLRQAIQRNAVLIIMRSAKHWYRAIPELQQYPQLFELLNPQNVVVSRGNCPNGFPLIEQVLLNAE